MTRLLASVRDAAEADIALAGGADIIDLKEPAAGALGAVPDAVVREVLARVAGRRPVSATVGDLPMAAAVVAEAVARRLALGPDFVKIGLFPGGAPRECLLAAAAAVPVGRLVAVLFADRAPDFSLLDTLADAGFAGVMVDTAGKGTGGLLDHLPPTALDAFVRRARALGLRCGLAGSLRLADIPVLLPLGADILGFRGALCQGGQRAAGLDAAALAAVRRAVGQASEGRPDAPAARRDGIHAGAPEAWSLGSTQPATEVCDRLF